MKIKLPVKKGPVKKGPMRFIKRSLKVPAAPRMRQYGDKGYKPSTGKGVGH